MQEDPTGTRSAKSTLYLEFFFSEESGTPPPSPKREIPFLGRDQMLWISAGVFRVPEVVIMLWMVSQQF
jgi:hypothetical protein